MTNEDREQTMNRDEILEYLGPDATLSGMREIFGGLTVAEIEHELDGMFPGESNGRLATAISGELLR